MTTANYLTVRDYFDQVLFGRTANRKTFSPKNVESTGSRTFHKVLSSFGNPQRSFQNYKSKGLTATDYLRHPIRITGPSNHQKLSVPSEKKYAAADKASLSAADRAAENAAEVTGAASREKGKPKKALKSSAAPRTQSGLNERLIIEKSIHKAARKYNLPANLLKGVIKAESNFQVTAVSHAGAQGLMQLMPATAKELGVENPFDIDQNIDGGARYLRKMLDSYGGDVKVALAAYNAGPGTVKKYGGNVPPYQETARYIDRVLRFSKQMA